MKRPAYFRFAFPFLLFYALLACSVRSSAEKNDSHNAVISPKSHYPMPSRYESDTPLVSPKKTFRLIETLDGNIYVTSLHQLFTRWSKSSRRIRFQLIGDYGKVITSGSFDIPKQKYL